VNSTQLLGVALGRGNTIGSPRSHSSVGDGYTTTLHGAGTLLFANLTNNFKQKSSFPEQKLCCLKKYSQKCGAPKEGSVPWNFVKVLHGKSGPF